MDRFALFSVIGMLAFAGAGPLGAQEPASNGVIGAMNGEGGDPRVGEALYAERCAKCHDAPSGRTPSKAVLQGATRAQISTSLVEGIMAPMARGLSPKQVTSIAAYLS